MLRIGLTGGIGAGKSTVAKIFESLGFPVFYSDAEAKSIVTSNIEVKNKIKALFGEQAYENDVYNRSFIAHEVFQNDSLLEDLNRIIHPAVRQAFDDFCMKQNGPFVLNEAAILFETGAYQTFDYNLLVCSPIELRMKRLMIRDNSSEAEIKARMDKQWPDEKKRKMADFIIENNENDSILVQVTEVIKLLNSRHQ